MFGQPRVVWKLISTSNDSASEILNCLSVVDHFVGLALKGLGLDYILGAYCIVIIT